MFVNEPLFGQKKYDSKTNKSKVTIEGNALVGYATYFEFEEKEVIKGWWEYSRKFGTPLNMRSYYKVTIPASETDGNVDMVIYSKSEKEDARVQFFLGIKEEDFDKQVKSMLIDFKKHFYIQHLVRQLEKLEAEAKKLSDSYIDSADSATKEGLLDKLTQKKSEIERMKEEIRKVERE